MRIEAEQCKRLCMGSLYRWSLSRDRTWDTEGDLAQTLLILSKVIRGSRFRVVFRVKGWLMKKDDLAILVTPVDEVNDVIGPVGGSKKVDWADARLVVVS